MMQYVQCWNCNHVIYLPNQLVPYQLQNLIRMPRMTPPLPTYMVVPNVPNVSSVPNIPSIPNVSNVPNIPSIPNDPSGNVPLQEHVSEIPPTSTNSSEPVLMSLNDNQATSVKLTMEQSLEVHHESIEEKVTENNTVQEEQQEESIEQGVPSIPDVLIEHDHNERPIHTHKNRNEFNNDTKARKHKDTKEPMCRHCGESTHFSSYCGMYKTEVCRFWLQGFCRNDVRCHWAHGETELRNKQLVDEQHCVKIVTDENGKQCNIGCGKTGHLYFSCPNHVCIHCNDKHLSRKCPYVVHRSR